MSANPGISAVHADPAPVAHEPHGPEEVALAHEGVEPGHAVARFNPADATVSYRIAIGRSAVPATVPRIAFVARIYANS